MPGRSVRCGNDRLPTACPQEHGDLFGLGLLRAPREEGGTGTTGPCPLCSSSSHVVQREPNLGKRQQRTKERVADEMRIQHVVLAEMFGLTTRRSTVAVIGRSEGTVERARFVPQGERRDDDQTNQSARKVVPTRCPDRWRVLCLPGGKTAHRSPGRSRSGVPASTGVQHGPAHRVACPHRSIPRRVRQRSVSAWRAGCALGSRYHARRAAEMRARSGRPRFQSVADSREPLPARARSRHRSRSSAR